MRVATTGGTGFEGRHLARALVTNGNAVVLIARHFGGRSGRSSTALRYIAGRSRTH